MVIEAETRNGIAPGQWIGPFKIRDHLCHVVREQESDLRIRPACICSRNAPGNIHLVRRRVSCT
jgi:hypothetical protein